MAVELERGGCIIFAWGPPWHWLPSIQRSRKAIPGGISLTWLWWGIYWTPKPVGALYLHSALWEQQERRRASQGDG